MSRTIFFSWQSDLSNNHHRSFIETCIKKALKNLSQDDLAQIYMDYDRDTLGRNGSPDISEVIFEKIERSIFFICDISIVTGYNEGRKSPNPNVLIELGYAAKQLGWERVICFFDENTGTVEELPFDLRQKRVLAYNPENPDEKKRVTAILEDNIKALFAGGKLFNPLNDYMKGRIDKNLLEVCKQLSNILYGTASMSDGLARTKDFLSMDGDAIRRTLESGLALLCQRGLLCVGQVGSRGCFLRRVGRYFKLTRRDLGYNIRLCRAFRICHAFNLHFCFLA